MAYLLPKSVFIHTPKTAGQWVASALENAGLVIDTIGVVHASPDEISEDNLYKERGFSFTFVRHPAAWYQSMWAHRMDEEWEPIDDPAWFTPRWIEFWADFTNHCRSESFTQFVRNCVDHYPGGFVSTLFGSYTSGCSFVGKHERLVEDLCSALDQAGEKYERKKIVETRPKNVRGKQPRRNKEVQYSADLLELVMNTEAAGIKRYGYDSLSPSLLLAHLSQTIS